MHTLIQLNEDIDGEIQLLSQTGPFTLPVKCLTKKCLVSLDKNRFDFGCVYLRETLRQRIIVYNAGALAADYSICAVLEDSEQAPPPSAQAAEATRTLTTQPTPAARELPPDQSRGRLSDRSNYSIMSNVEIFRSKEKDSGLGVIPADSCGNRLKSKSMGQISFQTVREAVEGEEPVDGKEGLSLQQGKEGQAKGRIRQRGGSPRPESKSAPGGSRSEIHPLSGGTPKGRGTPSISLQETPLSEGQAQQPVEGRKSPRALANTSSRMVAAGQSARDMANWVMTDYVV